MDICKKCKSTHIVMVEYSRMDPDHIDGVSEYMCLDCGLRVGRWTDKELAEGETEKPYGGRG